MGLGQYQIILVNLEPTIGSEIKKTRPFVIVSPDEMNKHLRTVIIAPMTTKSRSYPTRVRVKKQNESGWLVIDQLRTIDKQRIIKILGQLSPAEMNKTKRTIREMLVD
jgi:mRNA interferase MazF